MKRAFIMAIVILSLPEAMLIGCGRTSQAVIAVDRPAENSASAPVSDSGGSGRDAADPLLLAEAGATARGREILETGRIMTLARREIIRGGCWDYANAVYNRAGYPHARRKTVFKSRKSGPYADLARIQPGDWLYYVNRQYDDMEHSAIFVHWADFGAREALMLSYGGERRNEPARYRVYDVSRTYMIVRPRND